MRKKISFLLALVMIVTLLPAMGVSAATTTRINSVPRIASDKDWSAVDATTNKREATAAQAPRMQIKFESDTTAEQSVYLELTSGNAEWVFDELNLTPVVGGIVESSDTTTNPGFAIEYDSGDGWWKYTGNPSTNLIPNGIASLGSVVKFQQVSTTLLELKVPAGFVTDDILYIPLVVKATDPGDLEVSIGSGPATSNTLTFAIATSGATSMTISKVNKFPDTLTIDSIIIAELRAGSFRTGDNQIIKLTAPSGFEWVLPAKTQFSTTGGLNGYAPFTFNNFRISGNDFQVLEIDYDLTTATTSSGRMVLSKVQLRATDDAKYGDINIKISGAGVTSQSVLAGTYVTYGVSLTAEDKDLPVIYAGAYPKDWDDDAIKSLKVTFAEETVESWYSKRKTEFSVNDGVKIRGVKFTKTENLETNGSFNGNEIINDYIAYTDTNNANKISNATMQGTVGEISIDITDGKKFTTRSMEVSGTNNKAKIEMELFLSAEPGYTGPVTLTVSEDGGSSSKEMSADIATIEAPFSVETTSTDLSLGFQRLPVADILIKENGAEAIKEAGAHVFGSEEFGYASYETNTISRSDLFVYVEDMSIDKDSSTVTIEDGDMTLDKTRFVGGGLAIQVKRESDDPSTIAITGTTITLDRVLPQGDFELRIGGSACANYSSDSKLRFATFDKEYYVAMDDYAVVVTPADMTTVKNAIGVTVGSNTLKVGTQTVEMDTAPFLETSGAYAYMMVPARFVTEAVGASISFDANTKTATVFTSDNRITTFQVGTNYITVNGTRVPITGPSVLIRDSRIFLPFRVLGEQVLGVEVGWDESTQSATYIPAGADASVLGATTSATTTTPVVADTTTDETTDETEE